MVRSYTFCGSKGGLQKRELLRQIAEQNSTNVGEWGTVTQGRKRKGIAQNEGLNKHREFFWMQQDSAKSWKALASANLARRWQFNLKKM